MLPEESGGDPTLLFENHVLRAGWGLLLFLLLVAALVAVETALLDQVASLQDTTHTALIPRDSLGNFVVLLAAVGATWAMSLLEQRPMQRYGFAGQRKGKLFLLGTLSGAAVLLALVLLLHSLDLLVFRGETLFGTALQWKQGAIWAGFFLVVALTEELLARGYLQYVLTRGIASLLRNYFGAVSGVKTAFWMAASLMAVLFAATHALNAGESPLGLFNAGLFGLLLVLSLWRTGSLWWALGFHLAWDWTQSFLVGVHDSGLMIRDHLFLTEPIGDPLKSGGATGPEGSVYAAVALLAGLGLLLLVRRQEVYPELWIQAELDYEPPPETVPDPGGRPARLPDSQWVDAPAQRLCGPDAGS